MFCLCGCLAVGKLSLGHYTLLFNVNTQVVYFIVISLHILQPFHSFSLGKDEYRRPQLSKSSSSTTARQCVATPDE